METEFLNTAIEAARIGGGVLNEWSSKFTVSEKSPANLVTEADFASQQAIHSHIHGRYPTHGFLGEEGLVQEADSSGYRWVIDPLDGTSNYVHGFPYYAVSIALEQNGELIVGVIFDPNRNELFAARIGSGATLNGASIRTSTIEQLNSAMVVASLPVAVDPTDKAVQRFLTVMPHVQSVQRTGSAALNLAYVATGRIEAFWSTSLKPWDVAAGALIVQEAGGNVSKLDGSNLDIAVPSLLASNGPQIHDELQGILN